MSRLSDLRCPTRRIASQVGGYPVEGQGVEEEARRCCRAPIQADERRFAIADLGARRERRGSAPAAGAAAPRRALGRRSVRYCVAENGSRVDEPSGWIRSGLSLRYSVASAIPSRSAALLRLPAAARKACSI